MPVGFRMTTWGKGSGPIPPPQPKPYDSEVEFLESTGTQWIDTGIDFGNSLDFIIEMATPTLANVGWVHQLDGSGTWLCTETRVSSSSGGTIWYGNYDKKYNARPLFDGTTVHHVVLDSKHGFYLDGVLKTSFTVSYVKDSISGINLPLFTWYDFRAAAYDTNCPASKIVSCKIYLNGVLVRDYIPVRKDGVGYMYDRVSDELFGNQGTGAFAYGDDIVEVEYVQMNTPTQWIQTQISPTVNTLFRTKVYSVEDSNGILVGCDGINDNTDWRFFNFNENAFLDNGSARLATANGFLNNEWREFEVGNRYIKDLATGNMVASGTPSSSIVVPSGAKITLGGPVSWYITTQHQHGVARFAYVKFYESGNLTGDFQAIRIGSGSTWTGAMIDKTTRIVYRNRGTGAFLYGADKDPDARPLYRYMKVVVPETKGSADNQYEGTEQNFQVSRLDLLDASGNYFEYPAGTTATNSPVVRVNTDQGPLKLLNHAASQPNDKVCIAVRTKTGADNFPVTMTYDFGSACLNTAIYSRWTAYTSGDTGNIPSRNPSLKLYFSADGTNWDLADEVSYTAFPNTSSTQAFTRRLFPDYSIDGLICRYGGKDNGGAGIHNSSTTVWKNLGSLGQAFDASRGSAASFDVAGAIFSSSSNLPFTIPPSVFGMMGREWTVEVVFTPESGYFGNYHGVFGEHSGSTASRPGLVGLQYGYDPSVGYVASASVYYGSADACHAWMQPSVFQSGKPVTFTFAASKAQAKAAWYMNGVELTGNSPGVADIMTLSSSNAPKVDLSPRASTSDGFRIGSALGTGSDRTFRGTIHELRIYNKMITADTVANNFKYDKAEYGIVDAS